MPVRSEYTTIYTEESGRVVHATTHQPCGGKGCAECNDLGFTKSYPESGKKRSTA